jgi:hypothetical protein
MDAPFNYSVADTEDVREGTWSLAGGYRTLTTRVGIECLLLDGGEAMATVGS